MTFESVKIADALKYWSAQWTVIVAMFRYGMLITIEDKVNTGQHQSGAHPIHLGLKPYINVMFQALINEEISLFDKSLQWRYCG